MAPSMALIVEVSIADLGYQTRRMEMVQRLMRCDCGRLLLALKLGNGLFPYQDMLLFEYD